MTRRVLLAVVGRHQQTLRTNNGQHISVSEFLKRTLLELLYIFNCFKARRRWVACTCMNVEYMQMYMYMYISHKYMITHTCIHKCAFPWAGSPDGGLLTVARCPRQGPAQCHWRATTGTAFVTPIKAATRNLRQCCNCLVLFHHVPACIKSWFQIRSCIFYCDWTLDRTKWDKYSVAADMLFLTNCRDEPRIID